MKKLKDFKNYVIEDNSALTIKGGGECEGEETQRFIWLGEEGYVIRGDWEDTGCCEHQ